MRRKANSEESMWGAMSQDGADKAGLVLVTGRAVAMVIRAGAFLLVLLSLYGF